MRPRTASRSSRRDGTDEPNGVSVGRLATNLVRRRRLVHRDPRETALIGVVVERVSVTLRGDDHEFAWIHRPFDERRGPLVFGVVRR